MSQPRPRLLMAAILVVALSMLAPSMSLALPGGGLGPADRALSSSPGLLDHLLDMLSSLWGAKNGSQLDPSGSPGENGGQLDPSGKPVENGSQLDPHGSPGENGGQLDPHGTP